MTTNQDSLVSRLDHKEIRLLGLQDSSTPKNLRFIMKTVKLNENPVYHALSYCWNAPAADSSMKTITVNNARRKVRPTLYSFLKEMAASSSEIEIWIDSLCIDQNNVEERNQQVSIMADIYRFAESVYVWLGRGDESTNYAIEHIRDCSPETEFVLKIFSESAEKLFTLSYWTRRWVIQEFALAKQLVIACGKQWTTWDQFTKKLTVAVLPENGSAWKTLQSFEGLRDTNQRKYLRLVQLMTRFQHSRCIESRDKAFALRGIARDGKLLTVRYNESFGDLYFRLLSMLPTRWVLPVMIGYRWPHNAAKEVMMSMDLSKTDLFDSSTDSTDDLLFTVFEWIGKVAKMEDPSQDPEVVDGCGAFISYPRQVYVKESTTRRLYGRKYFKAGDDVYTLQSTTQSPRGLYVALASDSGDQSVVGLLLEEPYIEAAVYWQNLQLTEERMKMVEETFIHGVRRCVRSASAETSRRVLCHISRKVFVLLWLLDIGQIQHLYDRQQSLPSPKEEKEPLCCCLRGPTDISRLHDQNTVSCSCNLEILPNFPTPNDSEQWKAASVTPWSLQTSPLLLRGDESDGYVWRVSDAVDFRSHGRTQFFHAASECHRVFTKDLLSKLAVTRSGGVDDVHIKQLSPNRNDYPGGEQEPFHPENVDLNEADEDGRTPLMWAAKRGHEAVVKLLLEQEDILAEWQDTDGRTPLSWAAEGGHEAVVKLLLEREDVVADLQDKYGRTPLSCAAKGGHAAVVKLLLEREDVRADLQDSGGKTPLWWATERRHKATVKLLTEKLASCKP